MRDYGAIQAGFDNTVKDTIGIHLMGIHENPQTSQLSTLLAMSVLEESS